ncbi:MAG: hypothetical protein ACRD1T_16555, partial [Acidimicrobiia bacterium]
SPSVRRSTAGAVSAPPVDSVGEASDTPVSNEPAPPQNLSPVSTRSIITQYGLVHIEGLRLTNKYTECPISGGGECKNVSGGSKYIMFLTVKSADGKSGESWQNDLSTEAFESYVLTSTGARARVNSISHNSSNGLDVIFEFFDSASTAGLILYWPGNPPIKLEGIGTAGGSGGGSSGSTSGSTGSGSGSTQQQPPPAYEPPPEEEPPPDEPPPEEEPEDYFPPEE